MVWNSASVSGSVRNAAQAAFGAKLSSVGASDPKRIRCTPSSRFRCAINAATSAGVFGKTTVVTSNAEMIDLKFVDMLGSWQHCSYPVDTLDEGTFEEGVGFDGSSIRGWMGIHESDMRAVPDPR